MTELTYKQMHELFSRRRPKDAHKGDFGHVLVIAGSKGMAGAAILCARGALRAGAGLVTISVPDELLPIVQTAVPEATCVSRDLRTALAPTQLSSYDAIAVGPGLGTNEAARNTLEHLLASYNGKLVADADALNIIAMDTSVRLNENTVITPHPGEAGRLLGQLPSVIQNDREAAAKALAKKLECVVVLKGAGTLVAYEAPDEPQDRFSGDTENTNKAAGGTEAAATDPVKLFINTTGNPGMATGGSGDVLTGVIASFLAQKMDVPAAACAGVYVHGLAGDIAASETGERGLISGDLPLAIAHATKYLSENPNPYK